jgi:hypothetical protein
MSLQRCGCSVDTELEACLIAERGTECIYLLLCSGVRILEPYARQFCVTVL